MKFSILIANYNNGQYFKQCYDSIMAQTYQDFEVVVVDDCSTDDSFAVVKQLVGGDERFRVYQNDKNRKVGYTKKRLSDLAQGEVCGFLDPDDALVKTALEEVIKKHQKNAKAVAVYTQFYICDENLNIGKVFERSKKVRNNNKYFFNLDTRVSHFFTYKNKFYSQISYNPDRVRSADYELYLKLFDLGDFIFLKKPLYLYRIHGGGISQGNQNVKVLLEQHSEIIYEAMKRRDIKTLNGVEVVGSNKHDAYELAMNRELKPANKIKEKILSLFN